ncbi:MAG: response regulator transcription factor, partial [Planctomycetota bacterium]
SGAAPTRGGELKRMANSMASRELPADADIPLTPRETQVLRLVAMGLSNQEIADSLEISIETVKEHVQNMLRKLGLGDRTQAAVWALRHGLD